MMRNQKRRVLDAAIFLLAICMVAPIVSTFLDAFKNHGEYYKELLFECPDFYQTFWNSTVYATAITIVQLMIAVLCAFGMTQMQGWSRKLMLFLYIILMLMPLQVTLLPNYIGLRELDLLDTPWAIILPAIFQPTGVIILYQYLKTINTSIIDAAKLETKSIIRIVLVAVVPQIKAAMIAVSLYFFAESWNMLEAPMLFIKNERWQTLSVFISNTDKYDANIMYPAAVIFTIPVILFFLRFDCFIEEISSMGELV